MASSRVRCALIGLGRIADMHRPGYVGHPRGELALVCDRDEATARRRAAEWGVPRWSTDPDAVFDDPAVDAVEILTPHHLHAPLTIAAARAGKHVSVQKPMANTLAECDAMIRACREAGVILRVYENFVFYPAYVRAREILDAGDIGEPLAIRFKLGSCAGGWPVPLKSWLWRFRHEEAGGGPTIFDDGYHKLSLALELFGPVDRVWGYVDESLAAVDSPAVLAWSYEDGRRSGLFDAALAPNLVTPSAYYSADERVEIVGSRGWIRLARCTGKLRDEPPLLVHRDGRTTAHEDLDSDWMASFRACTGHFVDAVHDGTEPRLTGERGRDIVRFAFACYRAAESGREVRCADVTDVHPPSAPPGCSA